MKPIVDEFVKNMHTLCEPKLVAWLRIPKDKTLRGPYFDAYIWPRNEEGIEGTDYQERVYNRTEQLWREAGVKKNVTRKIPSVDEILTSCGRETESWKYNSIYLFTSGNKKTCWI